MILHDRQYQLFAAIFDYDFDGFGQGHEPGTLSPFWAVPPRPMIKWTPSCWVDTFVTLEEYKCLWNFGIVPAPPMWKVLYAYIT